MKFLPFILVLISLFPINLQAIDKDIRFRKIPEKLNFPAKSVDVVVQDFEGNLWFGSVEGLIKYNGTNLKLYEKNYDDSTSLGSRNVLSLFVDIKGNLWIGGTDGLSLYNPEKENFKCITRIPIKNNAVRSIFSTDDETLWLGTENGLLIYYPKKDSLSELLIKEPILEIKQYNSSLYLGTRNNGLKVFDMNSKKITFEINHSTYSIINSKNQSCESIDIDKNNNIWFVTYSGELFCYNHEDRILLEKSFLPEESRDNITLFSVLCKKNGRILIGSQNYGFYEYSPISDEYSKYTIEDNTEFSIVSNSIKYIYKDKDDSYWLCTHFGGICFFNENDLALKVEYNKKNLNSDLDCEIISGFAEDTNQDIWIATDGGGLVKFDRVDNSITGQFISEKNIPKNITDISSEKNGNIWATAWDGSYFTIRPSDKSVSFYKTDNSLINYKGLFIDSDNRKWLFPLFGSVEVYNSSNTVLYSKDNKGFINPDIFHKGLNIDAVEDMKKNIWLYGFNGLFTLMKNNSGYSFIDIYAEKFILSSSSIINVFVDSKNNKWVSTLIGLDKIDSDIENMEHVSIKYKFPKKVFSMLEDEKGYIWFTSSEGIGKFHPDTMKITFFEKNIGIRNEDFIAKSSYLARNGEMFFGSTKGFIHFFPYELKVNSSPPGVVITDFLLNNSANSFQDSLSPLTKSISVTDTIIIDYKQNVFGFVFSATSFISPENNLFSYRLIGFDDVWKEVGTTNSATYTNLNPGKYIFEVRAANNEKVWSANERRITIIITPPWWMTWWFRTFVILFIVFTIIFFWYYQTRKVRRENIILDFKVKKRTEELRKANEILLLNKKEILQKNDALEELNVTKDKFISIMAHDLKNPMSAIAGFSELLQNSINNITPEKANKYVEIIARSSNNVMVLLENLLEWSQSEKKVFSPQKIDLNFLVLKTIDLLSVQASKKEIELIFLPEFLFVSMADPNMITTVLRNLASNAIKYTPRCGKVEFLIRIHDEKKLIVEVRDTGIGMSEEKLKSLFKIERTKSVNGTENETGTGLGLILCREFISKHNEKIWAESKENEGTSFYFTLPLDVMSPL